MCKVMVIVNAKRVFKTKLTVETIAKHLQKTQRDGFGYSILGEKGLYGERTIKSQFSTRINLRELEVKIPIIQPTCNYFGVQSRAVGAGIFHGRTSTNDAGLLNTHPLNKDGWSLIHNGVVDNEGPDYKMFTTNDTEHILHHLITGGIDSVQKYISGYYAVAALDPNGNLHLFKDGIAQLYVCFNKTLDTVMFATTEELLVDTAKDLSWKLGPIDKVLDNVYMIFNRKGELVEHKEIKPLGYSERHSKYASKSLGYNLSETRDWHDYDYYGKYSDYVGGAEVYDLSGQRVETSATTAAQTDLEAYNAELDRMDASYTILDYEGNRISIDSFKKLDEVSKSECRITRADGTLVDWNDYFVERLG